MTGGTVTDTDDVFSLRLQGKVFIEGGNAVYLGDAQAKLLSNQTQHILAEILVLALDVLHDGNEVVRLIVVGRQNLLYTGQILAHGSSPSQKLGIRRWDEALFVNFLTNFPGEYYT